MKNDRDILGYPLNRGREDLDMGAFLNVRLIRTAAKMALLFQREALRPNGMNVMEWRVLVSICKLGDCHLRELSRTATIDASHVSRVTKSLEKRGLIRRSADPDDKRRTRLTLTAAGNAMVDRVWPLALQLSEDVSAHIGPRALDALNAALDQTRLYAEARLASHSQ